jgi:hypothetical protein
MNALTMAVEVSVESRSGDGTPILGKFLFGIGVKEPKTYLWESLSAMKANPVEETA